MNYLGDDIHTCRYVVHTRTSYHWYEFFLRWRSYFKVCRQGLKTHRQHSFVSIEELQRQLQEKCKYMLYTMVRTPTPGQFTAPIPLLTHAANPPKVVPDVSLIQAVSIIFSQVLANSFVFTTILNTALWEYQFWGRHFTAHPGVLNLSNICVIVSQSMLKPSWDSVDGYQRLTKVHILMYIYRMDHRLNAYRVSLHAT